MLADEANDVADVLLREQHAVSKCAVCQDDLNGDTYLICDIPTAGNDHSGHTVCSTCVRDRAYVGEKGACLACIRECGAEALQQDPDLLQSLGIAKIPAVLNGLANKMIHSLRKAEGAIERQNATRVEAVRAVRAVRAAIDESQDVGTERRTDDHLESPGFLSPPPAPPLLTHLEVASDVDAEACHPSPRTTSPTRKSRTRAWSEEAKMRASAKRQAKMVDRKRKEEHYDELLKQQYDLEMRIAEQEEFAKQQSHNIDLAKRQVDFLLTLVPDAASATAWLRTMGL
jgi:hypothetical protein